MPDKPSIPRAAYQVHHAKPTGQWRRLIDQRGRRLLVREGDNAAGRVSPGPQRPQEAGQIADRDLDRDQDRV
jgi:hypothetical protein